MPGRCGVETMGRLEEGVGCVWEGGCTGSEAVTAEQT